MGDVLIRGMEMPRNCHECEVGGSAQMDNINGCVFYHMSAAEQEAYHDRTPEKCPCVSVPPHGRLIDADALMEHLVGTHDGWIEHAHTNVAIDDERIVEEQATVIPASK